MRATMTTAEMEVALVEMMAVVTLVVVTLAETERRHLIRVFPVPFSRFSPKHTCIILSSRNLIQLPILRVEL
jgi:hypothetical protein